MSRSSDAESTAIIVLSTVFTCVYLTFMDGTILHWLPLMAALGVGLWVMSIIDP